MERHLYLSLIPEALIASQLNPEEFGVYYAVGAEKKTQGQAIFFELDPDFRHPFFPIEEGLARCVPHSDGAPKRSSYIAVYRVIEHVPISALRNLYLTTKDGRTLGLSQAESIPEDEAGLHLYRELAPLTPLVVSALGPKAFHSFFMKDPKKNISIPALSWVECKLGELATNPEFGEVHDLPYENIDHLRSCLMQLQNKSVVTKIVDRSGATMSTLPYRIIKNGIFYGTREGLVLYPLPPVEELKKKHYAWWRSANM
ncbi:MAG TPA: hypothetical protein PLG79_08770 [Spirochaetales bacterium]|mgnify:CR=1 FL=1|nr:hypothetical protein [Spirochaetales bacterium]HOV38800.1 hypothetical protein [Spirochaetales bacterium]